MPAQPRHAGDDHADQADHHPDEDVHEAHAALIGDAARVAHEHRLDERAVVQLPEELDRVALVGAQAAHLREQRWQQPRDELLATGGRQVGHVGRV